MFKMLKAMKALKKEGCMRLCSICLRKQIVRTTDNVEEALEKSIKSGIYNEITEGNCFVCGEKADYKVELKDAMQAIQAHRK